MRAIQFQAPRKIRLVDDMPVPEPGEGEVLVRCTHLGLCGGNVGPYTGAGHWADIDWPPPLGWRRALSRDSRSRSCTARRSRGCGRTLRPTGSARSRWRTCRT